MAPVPAVPRRGGHCVLQVLCFHTFEAPRGGLQKAPEGAVQSGRTIKSNTVYVSHNEASLQRHF
jgi:hypothetical protein